MQAHNIGCAKRISTVSREHRLVTSALVGHAGGPTISAPLKTVATPTKCWKCQTSLDCSRLHTSERGLGVACSDSRGVYTFHLVSTKGEKS